MHQQVNQFAQIASFPQPTVISQPAAAPGVQTIDVQTQAPIPMSDKVMRKFSGYMHQDGPKYLQEFESY